MNLIVDTNIVFSTLLNPHSAIGEILMNIQDEFTFFAPELLKEELKRYGPKIATYTKLDSKTLSDIEKLVLSTINFVSEESISKQSWVQAFALTKDIDEDDTPFIALGIELNAKLWTGDKILSKGLAKKGADIIVTTADLKKLIK
ncbi:MAG: putative nucleotide-binding protein [Mucilaginibacter sp.]|nr:putative nucleotide-binding protein [Mucilaginibacter sp.]